MPKVSIIVPVYNVELYLKRCLDSLANQTLQDIEIILVNDGSTDGSKEILLEYVQKYNQLFKYYEKENGGLSDARNYGLPYATGDYIAFLDSDDYVELDLYEKMYNIAIKENSDMVECDFYWEYPNKKKLDNGVIYNGKKDMMVKARVVAWNKLIKRELVTKHEIEFPKGLRYEDIEFFYKLLPYIEKVSFVKEPSIHYIQRSSSIANTQNEKTRDIFCVLDNVIKYYKDKDLFNEYKEELEYTYARLLLCSSLYRIVKINDKEMRRHLENYTWKELNEKFPKWKSNSILKKEMSIKNIYMRIINKHNFKLVCKLFELRLNLKRKM